MNKREHDLFVKCEQLSTANTLLKTENVVLMQKIVEFQERELERDIAQLAGNGNVMLV